MRLHVHIWHAKVIFNPEFLDVKEFGIKYRFRMPYVQALYTRKWMYRLHPTSLNENTIQHSGDELEHSCGH
jgi:hypothetical protein